MSNTVATTTHTTSRGEVTSSVAVEPVPGQDELVEGAVEYVADSCRHNVWGTMGKTASRYG